MRRWPLVASFFLFIALCASIAYWALQLFKPPLRPVAAPPQATVDVRPEAAAALFGGRAGPTQTATNYQLKGVVFSGTPSDSVAILSIEGKPAEAIRAGMEVEPGVTVEEVHRNYVLLSGEGSTRRVDLPEEAEDQEGTTSVSPVPVRPSQMTPPPAPAGAQQAVPPVQPAPAPPASPQPAPQATPQTAPDAAPQATPQLTPQTAPAPQTSPRATQTAPAMPTRVVRPSARSGSGNQPGTGAVTPSR